MTDPVRSRRRGTLIGAGAAVVVVAALIAWLVWPSGPVPTTVAETDSVESAPDRDAEVVIDEQWSIRVPRGGLRVLPELVRAGEETAAFDDGRRGAVVL